jgi:hypothetical protein
VLDSAGNASGRALDAPDEDAAGREAIPRASSRLLPALGSWMNANNRWMQVVLGFGFGIWLVAKAPTRCRRCSIGGPTH